MVYLALEPMASVEAIDIARKTGCAVWVGSDAITEEEHKRLTRDGVNFTRFAYPLAHASGDDIADALATVREHHPHEIIWIQYIPSKLAL